MPSVASVLTDFAALSTAEKNTVRAALVSPSFTGAMDMHAFIEKERFSAGRVCPVCGSTHLVRNGHRADGKQRYLCRDCGKTSASTTNSIASHSKKPLAVWEQFIDCLLSSFTIRKTAAVCKISKNTAFAWRHKALDALQNMANSVILDGIIEADETFFAVSYKGNHKHSKTFAMPRKKHKRGRDSHRRGLSTEQVCVPCAVNRSGLAIAKVSNVASVKTDGLIAVFTGRVVSGSDFVTDGNHAYVKFSKLVGVKLCQLYAKTTTRKGILNLQHINNYHSQLKRFMYSFNGVSSKYLNNYLIWHNYVNFTRTEY